MKYLLLFSLALLSIGSVAQNVVPHKAAKSTRVIIREGKEVSYWELDPKAPSQEYYLKHPHRKQRISFITDSDSTSYQSHYGKQFELVVELPDTVYLFLSIIAAEKGK
ncbi:hypothetical protein [Taibaiella soli]|uniref:Uncharacterized protein n=1 Tax=Taibaiella soli TaxID=1649169 RepID=A0A2W2AST3_9BACT|nr:hypothetical protein [Taibaiella soli]PZF70748.1 hypothetical protein DN068_21765 [Taibaiella soli]